MSDHILSLPITAESLRLATAPELLHQAGMRFLPQMNGMSGAIRADTGTLLRLDLPSDPLGSPRQITLRLRGPAVDPSLPQVETLPLVDGCQLVVRMATVARPTTSTGATVLRPITDAEADDWVRHRLTDVGLDPIELHISPSKTFGAPRGHQVWFAIRDIAATVAITDPDRAQAAYHGGIGRGRAYGLGMPVITATP